MDWHNLYLTDHGAVSISYREAAILRIAEAAERELSGSPILETQTAQSLLGKAAAIKGACERVAEYKFNNQ